MDWQPIETATTHKSIILCLWWADLPKAAPFVAEGFLDWDGVTWRFQNGEPVAPKFRNPTHWQPMPSPPAA